MKPENKKILLVLWVLAMVIFYIVRFVKLAENGDMDAAFVYLIGMEVMTVGVVFFAKLGDNARRFKILLSALPLSILLILGGLMGFALVSEAVDPANRFEAAAGDGDIDKLQRLMQGHEFETRDIQRALEAALSAEQIDSIGFLADRGADVSSPTI